MATVEGAPEKACQLVGHFLDGRPFLANRAPGLQTKQKRASPAENARFYFYFAGKITFSDGYRNGS